MPNWCANDLYVYGKDRDKLAESVIIGDNPFDFNAIIPMPEVLIGTHASSCAENGKILVEGPESRALELRAKMDAKLIQMCLDEYKGNKAAFDATGYWTWYDWSRAHWGVKWNTAEAVLERQANRLKYTFETPWSPPLPVIIALGAKFPSLTLSLRHFERGMQVKGRLKIKNGKVVEQWTDGYRGRRGG